MEAWHLIALLLTTGLFLIIVEIIFIPGSTFIGIAGFIVATIGIFLTFSRFGTDWGLGILTGFSIISVGLFYYAFTTQTWQRFALHQTISGKVNEDRRTFVTIGDVGRTASALRPSGKAEFGEVELEVSSFNGFIDAGCLVKVVKVQDNKVFVSLVD